MVRYPRSVEGDGECAPSERRFMTVCVASFAARSRAIVAIADKAVTFGSSAPIQADTGIKKMIPVGDSGWYTLIAGNPSFATAVVEKTKVLMTEDRRKDCRKTADSMMLCMRDAYQQCREALVEANILAPYLLTKKLWAERPKDLLPLKDTVSDAIQEELEQYSAKTSLLVFGFSADDPPQPHLFSIVDPGIGQNHDIAGNNAVGIGRLSAIGRMAFLEVDRNDPLEETLYHALDAKGHAENVQGVGISWDAWVALPNMKPVNVRKPIHDLMDRVFGFNVESPYHRSDFPVTARPPKTWAKQMKKYASEVLGRTTRPSPKSKSRKSKSKR